MGSRGSSSTKSMLRGHLKWARCSRQNAMSSRSNSGTGLHLRGRLHDTFHDFAQVLVGNTDHGSVVNRRVGDQEVLGLLGVDVRSPRDDHVGLAIREVEVPIVIEISDVTNGARVTDELSVDSAVLEGSLKYSKLVSPRNHTVPVVPVGQGSPHRRRG